MTADGVDEALWLVWPRLHLLPDVPPPTGRVVIVAAHPDDEVLGAGGLIARLASTPTRLAFVTVTDGEASHPGVAAPTAEELAVQRAEELRAALDTLGHREPDITRLRLPDSGVAAYEEELAVALEQQTRNADLVLCPFVGDGHSDHSAVGRVTLRVCAGRAEVWQIPIWMWHWTRPDAAGIRWQRAARFELSESELARKREAVACFVSQVQPLPGTGPETTMLPPDVLAHFDRPFEVFFR